MGYMAQWGSKAFVISPTKVAALEGLETTLTLKEDRENDTSGTQPTNTRGRELRPITFKVKYLAAAGVNPREQVESWEAELGKAYPLIIGGKRFGAAKMKLKQVKTNEIMLSNSGGFISATVSITLEEYSDGKTSKLVSAASSASAAKAATTYAATVAAKKAALSATPTASDKAIRSTLTKPVTEVQLS